MTIRRVNQWLLASVLGGGYGEALIADQSHCSPIPVMVSELIPTAQRKVIGVARSGGDFAYCEMHSDIIANKQTVAYWKGEQVIALKQLQYGPNRAAPEVVQRDFRTGELRRVTISGSQMVMGYQKGERLGQWQTFSAKRDLSSELPQSKEVGIAAKQVIDAGFDHFVREQWQSLTQGDTQQFYFASPVHNRNIQLRARLEAAACEQNVAVCVVVEPASGLLRLFAGELVLAYNANQQLTMFKGKTNIVDANGESQERTITYYYTN